MNSLDFSSSADSQNTLRLLVISATLCLCFCLFSCAKSQDGSAPNEQLVSTPPPANSGGGAIAADGINSIYGQTKDAVNGLSLANVTVTLFQAGSVVGITQSNTTGDYQFQNITNGNYSISFVAGNYIPITGIAIAVENQNINLNESLSKPTLVGQIRIVLTWYAKINLNVVSDLDSYLAASVSNSIVSYRNTALAWPDGSNASLDNDVSNYSGPETITLTNINNSTDYTYYINNYSSSSDCMGINNSGVHVDVYSENQVIRSYDVSIKNTNGGVTYEVFKIQNGQIVDSEIYNNLLLATKVNLSCH